MNENKCCQFDCHEYTWSEHGISGTPLGWGIRASSRADDRDLLHRIEKLAASACVDSQGRVPVEELMYETSLGFIKMVSEPACSGKDHRKNIRVRLYHAVQKDAGPELYLAPHDQWPAASGSSLPEITVSPIRSGREEILEKYHLLGPGAASFLSLVFSCVGQKKSGCIGVCDWEENRYAENSAELMLAVHLLLPKKARKYAGYLSFSREARENVPFYFRPVKQGKGHGEADYCLPADSSAEARRCFRPEEREYDSPWQYMCASLAGILSRHEEETYDRFLDLLDESMTKDRLESGVDFMLTMPWIFYEYYRREGGRRLPRRLLIHAVPQLCYWKAGGLLDESILHFVMDEVRSLRLSEAELRRYLQDLAGGMTSRTKEDILPEITRVMALIEAVDPGGYEQEMDRLETEYRSVFRSLTDMTGEGTAQPAAGRDSRTAMSGGLTVERTGGPKNLMETEPESDGRHAPEKAAADEQSVVKAAAGKKSLEAETRSLAREEADQETESYLSFLVNSMPQGFLTACMMFLSIYSIKIGHWKIALGMAGVWTLVMMNYQREILEYDLPYPAWMVLGLDLVEGLVVSLAAWLLPSQRIRLLFFLTIGLMTMLSQTIKILRIVRKDR